VLQAQSQPQPQSQTQAQAERIVYRVKRGDTLFSIARLYRTTVDSIKSWNKLRTNSIQVGQRLTIFPRTTPLATS
jgi:membrane-bound lytic murein transglycosylase D